MEINCLGSAEEIYQKLKTKLTQYQRDGKLAQVKQIDFDDAKLAALATGTGFKASLQCQNNLVQFTLDLGLMLKPLRSQIEGSIEKSLKKALA